MQIATAFRGISDPDDLVLCSDHHHHWVPSLSGRPVLLGYRGWLMSYGFDYRGVERDVRTMLAGKPGAAELLERYEVEFVVIGETEHRDYGADEQYFLDRHDLVLEEAGYKVFQRVRDAADAGRDPNSDP